LDKLSLLLLLLISFSNFSQVEELKKKYPQQEGRERVLTLLDICYYSALNDNAEAIRYGKMADAEAQEIGDSALIASVWNDWSIAYFYSGHLDSSLLLNQQALAYRTQLKDTMGGGGGGGGVAIFLAWIVLVSMNWFSHANLNSSNSSNPKLAACNRFTSVEKRM
jgi:hypothetical protein